MKKLLFLFFHIATGVEAESYQKLCPLITNKNKVLKQS